jgi:hypothetical protein
MLVDGWIRIRTKITDPEGSKNLIRLGTLQTIFSISITVFSYHTVLNGVSLLRKD